MTRDAEDTWTLAGRRFHSRLIVGTGKYASLDQTREALARSGAEMVTVALRRVELDRSKPSLLDAVDPARYVLLPNTAGCYSGEDAIRTARLARELGMGDFIKLEVIGDPVTLYPDHAETVAAARVLVGEGFHVLPYCTDDLVTCVKLAEAGCAAVMPLAAPIGSGLGIRNPYNLRIIIEQSGVPVIVDAGVGTASHAAEALELGCDAVLMNTAIAGATDPLQMARAMRLGVEAGRLAYLAGRIPAKLYATASSPLDGLIR
jgi:thiazole synthase